MAQYITIDAPPSIAAAPGLMTIRTTTVIQLVEVIEVIVSKICHMVYQIFIRLMSIAFTYVRSLTMRGPPTQETYYGK